jgi:peptidoglycan hydrolase-like amidase
MAVRPQTLPTIRTAAAACAAALLTCALLLAVPAVARADSVFAVSGRGWGHGIGLSQWGAKGYAERGWGYASILAWYYQHTTLSARDELTVKVDLDASKAARTSWRIAAASPSTTLTVSDYGTGRSFEVTRSATVWITFSGGKAVLRSDRYDSGKKAHVAGSVVATFTGSALAATGPSATSKVRLLDKSGPFSQSNIAWRGRMRFTPVTNTGNAVDYVPMEQYLRGVVPRESGSSFPAEALRAQAVAARSYAYGAAAAGRILWCTTMSQVYNGADDGTSSHEAASTDSAIADTANKVVTYGSSVVQAFFFSSSGGRTANSKDVWFSSRTDRTSPVYYTSVVDADSDSPDYRWSLADMSGTTLAGKIRTHYSSLAHPSPAPVATVTLEVGTSGFVRYVTVHWSKGADTVLTGPEMQHALGMKSSAFTMRLKNPPPPPAPPATRFQESDTRPLWTGSWRTVKTASASGGAYRRSSARGSTLTVSFKGTSVAWIGTTGPRSGRADVRLDGARLATADLYASKTAYRATVWRRTGLSSDATHTLVIRVLGTHRTGSGASDVGVDAIDVAGTLLAVPRPPVWRRYDQSVTAARYAGAWTTSRLAGMWGGTHAFSHATSATATFAFTGTKVRWIGKKAPNYGKAWVSIDASAPVLVDLYSAKSLNQQRLFESAALRSGAHTVTITASGARNTKSTYHYVDVDAFEALEPVK